MDQAYVENVSKSKEETYFLGDFWEYLIFHRKGLLNIIQSVYLRGISVFLYSMWYLNNHFTRCINQRI